MASEVDATFEVIAAVAGLLSLAASVFLLAWFSGLDKAIARRLMARQLWHLALADVITSALIFPNVFPEMILLFLGPFSSSSYPALNAVCWVSIFNNLTFMTSVFIEVHIALSTVAVVFHCSAAVRLLSRILPVVWVLGCIVGAAVVWLGDTHWDLSTGSCNQHIAAWNLKVAVTTAALAISIALQVAGLVMDCRRAGETVRLRHLRQATVFGAAVLITWLPFGVFFVWRDEDGDQGNLVIDHGDRVAYCLTYICLSSNSFFHALFYACFKGFVGRNAGAQPGDQCGVQPGFRVAFSESSANVVSVPGITVAANLLAEQETAALEYEREFEFLQTSSSGSISF